MLGDLLDRQAGLFEKLACLADPLGGEPLQRWEPELGGEPAGERAGRGSGLASEQSQRQRDLGLARQHGVAGDEDEAQQFVADGGLVAGGIEVVDDPYAAVEGAEAGTQILAKDVTLPSGVELVSDEEMLVINVTEQISAEALDAELAEAEAEAGIEHEESDQETEGDDAAEAPAEGDAAEGSEDSE